MPHLELLQPGAGGQVEGVLERRLLCIVGRIVGLVAGGEVRPDARDRPALVVQALLGASHDAFPVREGGTSAVEAGVDLELHAGSSAGAGDGVELGD